MENRRDFLKKLMLLAGTTGVAGTIPPAIQRALAIEAIPGSTFLDAEHVVILMQENRSFDHSFGTMKGVRGFDDPRFVRLPNGYPVWFQSDKERNTYAPFRLNMRGTKATWMGAVPHSRHTQVDAFNDGKHDQWIEAKKRPKPYDKIPLTMGFYNRQDIPFNYALADAFTVCDQNFCSGMTSTWPNRLFFWTGTVREDARSPTSKAWMRNDLKVGEAKWKTFPERLEEKDISWKIYQNDVTCGGGFIGEERSWLSNFGCNPLELFEQYHVKFTPRYRTALQKQVMDLPGEIEEFKARLAKEKPGESSYNKMKTALDKKEEVLAEAQKDLRLWAAENFDKLDEMEQHLFRKAFVINREDPGFHSLDTLEYMDEKGQQQELTVPKGDILHEFRKDVESGTLPAVSWMVPAEKYSDHPTAPWYGSWYVSEIMDILTKNPDVWKKTILIMTYDENDGYFDHIPPFVPPHPDQENSGKCSAGIDPRLDYTSLEQELAEGKSQKEARGAAIGLGYRVPLIIASPWTKGGHVCSQVFDHTSTLQFLESFFNFKLNKGIREENISTWRRTVCGDLTAAFLSSDQQEERTELPFIQRDPYLESIHRAQFKDMPSFKHLSAEELNKAKQHPALLPDMPKQEPGMKTACPLPYELYSDFSMDGDGLELTFKAGNNFFGERSAGAPFTVYYDDQIRSYAVMPGDMLKDRFVGSANDAYRLGVHGPNGFYRLFRGKTGAAVLSAHLLYEANNGVPTGNIRLLLTNRQSSPVQITIKDNAYGRPLIHKTLSDKQELAVPIVLKDSYGWYDLSLTLTENPDCEWTYAGRVETGKLTHTDPQIGR